MTSNIKLSKAIYKGLSTNRKPITLIASIGGNKATSSVLELTLVPTPIIENWTELTKDAKQQGPVYVQAMREHIDSVCPSSCRYVQDSKGCYVQHNVRNAGQVARIMRDCVPNMWDGLHLDDLAHVAKIARMLGVQKVRSMVAGDASMIPVNEWQQIESTLLKYYPADKWLGYTHDHGATHLQQTHVASCDNEAQAHKAMLDGWNVFEVVQVGDAIANGATLCPKSKEFFNKHQKPFTCNGCPVACNGSNQKQHRVVISHGSGDASRKAAQARRGLKVLNKRGQVRGLYAAQGS